MKLMLWVTRWFMRGVFGRRTVLVELGIGDALDRLSILETKLTQIDDSIKRDKVKTEFDLLRESLRMAGVVPDLIDEYAELLEVNGTLWHVEDLLRERERLKNFDSWFVQWARSVYQTNDHRAAIKRRIDARYQSLIEEVKSYV